MQAATETMGALPTRRMTVLVLAVFVAGLCSIVYELLIGTVSSYFLGDSVRQFSITIGIFMAAMGLGSYLSRNLEDTALEKFLIVEVALGCFGGLSVPILYYAYAYTTLYEPIMVSLVLVVGALTGLEIPTLVLIMKRQWSLAKNISSVLTLDYLGALAATLLFPFALLPFLGTFRSALLIGLVNLIVAAIMLRAFQSQIAPRVRALLRVSIIAVVVLLGTGFALADQMLRPWHSAVYEDRVVFSERSAYQQIVMTRGKSDVRLFLDGNLQFSSIDEHRYHESLVMPVLAAAPSKARVLVLGGGEGLAVRELLKDPAVEKIVVVDLDPAITRLATTRRELTEINRGALDDARVTLVHRDAFTFMGENEALWDVIIADLPDPNNASLARLYSREFFGVVKRRLSASGVFVTQATSPYFAKTAFWCIERSMREAGLSTLPYHAYVPSFGDWGFVMGAKRQIDSESLSLEREGRFVNKAVLRTLFVFEDDLRAEDVKVSTLDRPEVLGYYLSEWKHWN